METLATANREQATAYVNELFSGGYDLPKVTADNITRDIPGAIEYRIMTGDLVTLDETPRDCRRRIVQHLWNKLGGPDSVDQSVLSGAFEYTWVIGVRSRRIRFSYYLTSGLLIRLIDFGAAC